MKHDVAVDDLRLTANTIRGLSMDGVQAAKSGHPGMPMGMADVAAVLFLKHLNHCPTNPGWINRDRFVLSAGHGSMLLYSLLHLAGYDLPLEELQRFRQWNSKTPGHPEYGHTVGVETTTGPLGQGCANAAGMALCERMLAERLNGPAFSPIDHYTYVICGDGDLMEGISHEAFSLAGHLGLNKLIVFFDSNNITIEGSTELACSDNVKKRFQGYNWNVLDIDAHDYDQIDKAIRRARREKNRPTIIICRSQIGFGSPNKQGKASSHGEPLGEAEVVAAKRNLGLPEDKTFYVPDGVRGLFLARLKKMQRQVRKWEKDLARYMDSTPDKAAAWHAHFGADLSDATLDIAFDPAKPVATRAASGKVIQALAARFPQVVGGSADLAPSTKTLIAETTSIGKNAFSGRNLHFGIREHAMCAMLNGMTLHGGFRVFGATFFVFADYCRPSIRLAALMKLPVIYVFTHDSFYVGEDGPTHEPIEHLASLRCIPGVTLIRPADATETAAAWLAALRKNDGPVAIMLTRQDLPIIDRTQYPPASNVEKGAYVLWQSAEGDPDILLIASGSEVSLALESAKRVAARCCVRVVSMPSWELFDKQPEEYRLSVLPPACRARLAIEAGVSMGWRRYVGENGRVLSLEHFGSSAPYKTLAVEFGFTPDNAVAVIEDMLAGGSR